MTLLGILQVSETIHWSNKPDKDAKQLIQYLVPFASTIQLLERTRVLMQV